jgi:quinol monooxygenase YgiN
MHDRFGLHVLFRAQPGAADELERLLLEAAAAAGAVPACRLYVVGRPPEDDDLVWVMEAWDNREAHDASLEDPAARELIRRAMPLLAARPEARELKPSGGNAL